MRECRVRMAGQSVADAQVPGETDSVRWPACDGFGRSGGGARRPMQSDWKPATERGAPCLPFGRQCRSAWHQMAIDRALEVLVQRKHLAVGERKDLRRDDAGDAFRR